MTRPGFRLFTCFLILILGWVSQPVSVQSAQAVTQNLAQGAAYSAFAQALADYNTRHHSAYHLVQYQQADQLAYATAQTSGEDYFVLLAELTGGSSWIVLIPGESPAEAYNQRLDTFPASLIDAGSKAMLRQGGPATLALAANFSGHKLPWPFAKEGYVTQKDTPGSHENQIDFDIQGLAANGDVYATKPGTVVFVKQSSSTTCKDAPPNSCWEKANMVVIKHNESEYSWYVHLAYNSVPVSVGQNIGYGTKIGVEGETGFSFGVHLHYMVSTKAPTSWPDPSNPNEAPWPDKTTLAPVDFDESNWANLIEYPEGPAYTSQNAANLPSVCPGAGGVLLYRDKDYGCANKAINDGYVFYNTVGEFNLPSSFDNVAASIRVPTGWSALLYEGTNAAGRSTCIDAPGDADLSDNPFTGSTETVGQQVSALKVFYGSGCTGNAADPNPVPSDSQVPAVSLTLPAASYLTTNSITIQASATDAGSGVTHVQFFAGYDDGTSWAWHNLGYDTSSSDGWSTVWDATAVPDQTNVIFFANAWDRAGNKNGNWITGKVLDRHAPATSITSPTSPQTSNRFRVTWSASDNASGVDHVNIEYQDQSGSEPTAWKSWLANQSATISSGWFNGELEHTYAFRSTAIDKAGNVSSPSEPVLTTVNPCSPDGYEPDDDRSQAHPLILDVVSPVNWFCGPGDQDWYVFTPTTGKTYLFFTSNLGPATDTVMDIIAADGTTIKTVDDANSPSSQFVWTADRDTSLYIKVRHASSAVAGTGVTYTVEVATPIPLYLPFIARNAGAN